MSVNFSHAIVRATVGAFGMAVCAGILLAGAAAASPSAHDAGRSMYDTNTRVQTVSYADLDLSSSQGRAALKRRIQAAARSVCDMGFFGSGDRWLRMAEQRCYHDAVYYARPRPTVTAAR